MNIFVLDKDPKKAAQYHVDKHVIKMILESSQMLATAYYTSRGIKSFSKLHESKEKELMMVEVFEGFPRRAGDEKGTLPTTFWIRGINPYRPAFVHHLCTQWAGKCIENWNWLHSLALELCKEFTHRYGKTHACQEILEWMSENPALSESLGRITPHALAMPNEYIYYRWDNKEADPVQSYRNYYLGEKKALFSWTNRKTPKFVLNATNLV